MSPANPKKPRPSTMEVTIAKRQAQRRRRLFHGSFFLGSLLALRVRYQAASRLHASFGSCSQSRRSSRSGSGMRTVFSGPYGSGMSVRARRAARRHEARAALDRTRAAVEVALESGRAMHEAGHASVAAHLAVA